MQINREKRQAFVEFLTPEDATAAISFDGRSLNGSVLRIRRPKEYVETVVRFPPSTSMLLHYIHFSFSSLMYVNDLQVMRFGSLLLAETTS
jgi:RNA recognition motif-containing protein